MENEEEQLREDEKGPIPKLEGEGNTCNQAARQEGTTCHVQRLTTAHGETQNTQKH